MAVNRVLEAGAQAHVELAAGQVVGDGVLGVVDVGDPVVAAHVGDVHQVEAVQTEPDFLEVAEQAAGGAVVLADELVTQAHIHTLVGGLAHVGVGTRQVGRRGGQTVADDALEAELQTRDTGEVVGEEQGNAVALVGGAGHLDAVQVLLRLHQRETEPGVGALDELSEQFHVNAGDIALGGVDAAIDELEVVNLVGDEVAQVLVIGFGSEFEGTVQRAEGVVTAQDDLDAALRLDVLVEQDIAVTQRVHDLPAVFLVERCLVIDAACQT